MKFTPSIIAALYYSLTASSSFANCERWSEETASNRTLTVGSIQIKNTDVFDTRLTRENQSIHQLANRLHIESKRELIEAQLLFAQGDVFDLDSLAETERNLRSNAYLRSASVTPKQICDDQVDILVETGDHWSLLPSFNFARAGGENTYSFLVSELNLLGLGKQLQLGLDFSATRDQRILFYHDPMLLGSNTEFTAELQYNTDGEVQVIEFEQPFKSLNSTKSWRVRTSHTKYDQNIYDNGAVVDQLAVDRTNLSVEYAFSKGKQTRSNGSNIRDKQTHVLRWRFGWQFSQTELGTTGKFTDTSPTAQRIFSYPFVQMNFLAPEFIKQTNMQQMESVEDIAIGHNLRTRLGFASEKLGSSVDANVFEAVYSKGWQPQAKILGLFKTSSAGYVTKQGLENGISKLDLEGFYFANRKNRFYASANFANGQRLFENQQVLIGGETGLRGYPLKFQTGSRRARFTLEQRHFFDWYPLRLVRVGTAVFADLGAAWDQGEDPDWLRDVGFGLRIVGTRQANAKVLHADFAFPLDAKDDIESFQFVVSAKSQF